MSSPSFNYAPTFSIATLLLPLHLYWQKPTALPGMEPDSTLLLDNYSTAESL